MGRACCADRHTVFGVLQSTQDPTIHLSELRETACFPVNHVLLRSLQKSSALAAVAACNDVHVRVGCNRFLVLDLMFEASCNVPKTKEVRIVQSKSTDTNQVTKRHHWPNQGCSSAVHTARVNCAHPDLNVSKTLRHWTTNRQ